MTRTITITSGKGGVGKTNLSVNLALCLALQEQSTCLFDADLGLANVNLLLGLYPRRSLEDVISGRCGLGDITVRTAGIDIIAGSSGVEALADLNASGRDRLAESLSTLKKYDFLLFDTSAGISRNVVSFCLSSPEVILVIVPEVTSLTDAYALLKILALNRFSGSLHVAVNRCRSLPLGRQVFGKFQETVKRYLRFEMSLLGTVPDDDCVEESVAAQEPFIQRHPDCPASRHVMSMARQLIKNPPEDRYPSGVQSFWRSWMRHRSGPLQITAPGRAKKQQISPSAEKTAPATPLRPERDGISAARPEPGRNALMPPEPHLPVLPAVALACIEICRSTTDPRRIGRLIRLDAAMTANVLGLAAGGIGADAHPAGSVQQAIASVQVSSVETLVLSCARFTCFQNPSSTPTPNLANFWQHGLRCALLAEQLAARTGQADPREAYLAGLLHDIGKLAAAAPCGEKAGGPGEKQASAGKYPAHAATGAGMLAGWGLSPLLVDAVRYHHAPAGEIRHAFALVKIVFVANSLAGSSEGAGQRGLQHADQLLAVRPQSVHEIILESETGIQKAAGMLGLDLESVSAGNSGRPAEKDLREESLFEILRSQALLGGWLQSLMDTQETAAAVDKICATIRLLFKVPPPLFFIHDTQHARLVCQNPPTGIRLNIDLQTDRGLLVTCFRRGAMVTSFDEASEIMDRQIAHLLNCEGLVCLPVAGAGACRGIIVIAVDKDGALRFKGQQPILSLLVRQAACVLSATGPPAS